MNKKFSFPHFKLTILLIFFSVLFGFVPSSRAQSVQEWSDPVNLSMSGAATNPTMVVDSNGTIHVIWLDKFDGYKYSQSTDGVTWTAPITVQFPFSPKANPPKLFSDASGNIHIFWLSDENKLSYAQTLPENLASPLSWRTKTEIGSSVLDFDANLDAQGVMHATYVTNPAPAPGSAGVFYRHSSNGGINWESAIPLYESPYFRITSAEDAHVRVAVSDTKEKNRVYAIWDDRPQKRIFLATSADNGLNWDPIKEMVIPQANLGYATPYYGDIQVMGDKVLATWFVGEPGTQCSLYSWSSTDGGETWGEQALILPDSTQCPEKSEFIPINPALAVDLFTAQQNLSLSAWNGTNWSNLEVQTGPSSSTDPATFEPVAMGCQQVVPSKDRLIVVGCDTGGGGDIWFITRKLDSLDYLFPQPSEWSNDTNIISTPREVSSLSSIADDAGNVHAVWVQSPKVSSDASSPVIQYSSWKGSEWTRPSPIFSNLDGLPLNLSLQIDNQNRLLLSWVNQKTGELMFTWSNALRANIPQEWLQPLAVIAPSKLTNSPDMLVDAADRIMIAYAITVNEDRGIYVIQSTDLGATWSSPVKVFDAVAAGWEMVDQPKLAVTEDGTLHLIFTKYDLTGGPQPTGLYYSQSSDGGITWTPADVVSEQPVQWSKLIAYQGTLHRLWQERTRLAAQTNHQVSHDAGKTWDAASKISSDADINSMPDVSIDGAGKLHYLQVVGQDKQVFEEWEWNEGRWQSVENRKIAAVKLNSPPTVESGITSTGNIYSLLQFEKVQDDDGSETDIWNIHRSLDMTEPASPIKAIIPTPSTTTATELAPVPQATGTPVSPLMGVTDDQPPIKRNLIGLGLVVIVVLLILFFILPKKGRAQGRTKN